MLDLTDCLVHKFQGPDSLANDEPLKILGKEITDEERRKLVLTAYEQLKTTFEKFQKPAGDKKSPAKTCSDLSLAHPDFASGNNCKTTITLISNIIVPFYVFIDVN